MTAPTPCSTRWAAAWLASAAASNHWITTRSEPVVSSSSMSLPSRATARAASQVVDGHWFYRPVDRQPEHPAEKVVLGLECPLDARRQAEPVLLPVEQEVGD